MYLLTDLTGNQCKLTKDISIFAGKSYSLRPGKKIKYKNFDFIWLFFLICKGSACSGMQGYCDVFSKCRSVNAQGVLSRLAKTLLKPTLITIDDLKTWAIVIWKRNTKVFQV